MILNNFIKYSTAILLIILYITTKVKTCDVDLVAKTNNGFVMGQDNDYYFSYTRIPYAKPPVDELRFEPPQPYEDKWDDIYDGSQKPIACLQWDQLTEGENKLQGSEDCLFVNVYKPKTRKRKYPVMAYLHGGAFMFGSVDTFGEDYLMKRGNVILVTISYRLGPLGFLSTEDDIISGNYGLKDQRLALKWIKENIHHFGGDPEQILLMGFSAGAASTHLHTILPPQPDLLKVTFSSSGAALNPWVIIKNPLKRALKLAQHLQCPDLEDTRAIKQCLQHKPAEDIVASVKEFLNSGYNPFTTFGPVVEHKNSVQAFMTEHPRDIIKSGNYPAIPWLVAYTAQDGGYNAAELLVINPETGKTYLEELNSKWLDLAPQNLFLENIHDEPKKYAQQLREKYLGNLPISEETYLKVQDIYTDILFKNGIIESMKLHSANNNGPVYGYVYDNPSDINVGNYLAHREDFEFGTVHSDDFSLIMSLFLRNLRLDEEILSQKFMKMLEDFVTEGELSLGDCKFVNNAGRKDNLEIMFITRDKCENKVKALENHEDDLIVPTNNGKLKGSDKSYYYSFEAIPYAKAPINEFRFEAPQAYDTKWENIYDSTKKSIECMQWDHLKEGEYKLHGSEDCLYLNVYKPKTGKESYPVLAYLHGGAFMFGSVDTFGEDYLMKQGNVILVTIAYRLGPLGFLSTGDESISGNYGLKDQQLALKWIKQNIHYFGGDPEKILLIGFSAGAASAHLHMLQSSEKNLVKAAASISGTALNPWAIHKNPLKKAIKLAKLLDCPDLEDTLAIKQCLQQKPAEDIVASVKEFFNIGYNPVVTFGPVVEHKNVAQAFITEHPRDIIKSGSYSHIPWLASYTAQDGGYNAAELLQINPKTGETFLEELNTKWLDLAPENLFLENISEEPRKNAQLLKDSYLGNLTFSEKTYLKVQEMYTDMFFRIGIEESLKLHAQNNKEGVYGYIYDNPSDLNVANFLAQRNDLKFGTVHSDDFSLMMSFYMRSLRPDEEIISQKFLKMLEDFANKGELTFGNCKFVNNAGHSEKLEILYITKDKCENKVV